MMAREEIRTRVLDALGRLGGIPYDRFLLEALPGADYTKERELELRDVLADLVIRGDIETDRGWYRLARKG